MKVVHPAFNVSLIRVYDDQGMKVKLIRYRQQVEFARLVDPGTKNVYMGLFQAWKLRKDFLPVERR